MIDISKGRYWGEGIQLVDGCTPCSPGCDHCWSAGIRHRFQGGLTKEGKVPHHLTNVNGKFNGYIEVHPDRLKRFNTRKPKVFAIWNDLLYEKVDRHFIEDSLTMMWKMSKNIYLILTKRPERLSEISRLGHWPYDNVYLGLTVCNQQEMEDKGEVFFSVPGNKFLSFEPLLSKIIIPPWVIEKNLLSTVILGGETGLGARPMHPDWVRSIRDQCAYSGVPFFFKQWGEWLPFDQREAGQLRNSISYPDNGQAWRIGRNKSGRLLDGRTHDDLPWVKIG